MFFKIVVLKSFRNFTWKHLCWSLFLIKLQFWGPATLETPTQVFSCEISEVFKNTFIYKTPLVAASYKTEMDLVHGLSWVSARAVFSYIVSFT